MVLIDKMDKIKIFSTVGLDYACHAGRQPLTGPRLGNANYETSHITALDKSETCGYVRISFPASPLIAAGAQHEPSGTAARVSGQVLALLGAKRRVEFWNPQSDLASAAGRVGGCICS